MPEVLGLVRPADPPRGVLIELRVAKENIGVVIGKQGRTAYAMRTILPAASMKFNKRAVLEIIE